MEFLKKICCLLILFLILLFSCRKKTPVLRTDYKTQNVIIIIIDGARYSETWGDPSLQNIPLQSNLLYPQGVLFTNFYNNGPTYTTAGHTAITTGIYQELDNSGLELPIYPSIFQLWSSTYSMDNTKSWVIASKDKVEIIADCQLEDWNNKYNPNTNCGLNGMGVGTGYRHDSITLKSTIKMLSKHHPNLVLISFREPDFSAHQNNWNNYNAGILSTDEYIYQLYNFIETDNYYKGKTSIFITNDHGRHLDNTGAGFSAHGDGCDGCRHISLLAIGPDFKKGVQIETEREQIDISATIAELLGFQMPYGKGEIMYELYE